MGLVRRPALIKEFHRELTLLGAILLCPVFAVAQLTARTSPWSYSAGAEAKETYDGNVFLQDHGNLARRHSMVTAVSPGVSGAYQESPAFKAALSYLLDASFYHDAPSESNLTHRGALNFSGQAADTTWEALNRAVWIDGSRQGPTFTSGGDVPAIGGIPLRDRRAALVCFNSFKATRTLGSWFVRPVFNSYVHDFRTEQHAQTGAYVGYENYMSRNEVSGGADVGFEAAQRLWVVLGYRYGHQHQGRLLGKSSPYSSDYQRPLAGVEGSPVDWAKFNLLIGPDIRAFAPGTQAGFDRNKLLLYFDGSLTLTPSRRDTLVLTVRRYEQPAFSSQSVYEDITYDFSWQRRFNERLTAGAGFNAHGGTWQAPARRNDWILTPSGMARWSFNKKLAGEVSFLYDKAESLIRNTQGREYTRPLLSASMKYSF